MPHPRKTPRMESSISHLCQARPEGLELSMRVSTAPLDLSKLVSQPLPALMPGIGADSSWSSNPQDNRLCEVRFGTQTHITDNTTPCVFSSLQQKVRMANGSTRMWTKLLSGQRTTVSPLSPKYPESSHASAPPMSSQLNLSEIFNVCAASMLDPAIP